MGQKEMAMNGKNRIIRRAVDLAVSAAFDYPLTAKACLSRSSRLGTHTRSIQAHFRAAQSSPPRPLWFCIADMHSCSSKGLSRHTIPCDRVRAPPCNIAAKFDAGDYPSVTLEIGMNSQRLANVIHALRSLMEGRCRCDLAN
jgi:hypothetical protein